MNIMLHPCIDDPSHANIMDALELQCQEAEGMGRVLMRPELFHPEADHAHVEQARDWWPRDTPPMFAWATSLGGSVAMHNTLTNTETLVTHLQRQAGRVVAWLRTEGRDVEHPNETKGERLARRNRERAAQTRERNRDTPTGERPATSVAWDRVVELRRQRAAALDDADALVREAYQLMTDRAEDRKALKRDWDAKVGDAEQEHHRLKNTRPAS